MGHIELGSASVNLLLNGPRSTGQDPADPVGTPLEAGKDMRNTHHYIASGFGTLVGNSLGQPWRGDYFFPAAI